MNKHRIIVLGSVIRAVSLVATTLVGFFLMPFLVHRLGDHIYGYWTLVGAVLGYYGVLDLGITPAVQFQVARAIGQKDSESQNRTISTAVVAFAGLGLVALVATLIVAGSCSQFISNSSDARLFRDVLVIMGISFAFGFPGRAFMGAVNAHLRNDLSASVSILVLILRTSLIISLILAGGGLIALALASLVSDAATYLANYLILRRIHKGLKVSIALAEKSIFRELFHYGRYSVIIQVGDQLRFAADAWMVAAFVGLDAVTHYAIASRLSNYYLIFMISNVGVISPWFSQLFGGQAFDGIRKVLELGTKVSAALSVTIFLSFALYGRAFIARWMGATYVDAYWPSLLLLAAIFCDVAQLPSVGYLLGVSKHRYLAYQTLAEGIANLGLSIYWGRSYGMVGVAMGTLIPMFVAKVILQPAYVCRSAGVPLAKYYLRDVGGGIAAPTVCCFGLWALFLRNIELSSLATVCEVVVLQAFACGLAAFYLALGVEDRQRMLNKLWSGSKTAGPQTGFARAMNWFTR